MHACTRMYISTWRKNDPGVCVADLFRLRLSTHLQQVMPYASTCILMLHEFNSLAHISGNCCITICKRMRTPLLHHSTWAVMKITQCHVYAACSLMSMSPQYR